jgi:hypothetical protein
MLGSLDDKESHLLTRVVSYKVNKPIKNPRYISIYITFWQALASRNCEYVVQWKVAKDFRHGGG